MRCPVPCYICGDFIELSDAKFETVLCGCRDNCTHGVCVDCLEGLEDDEDEL